MEAVFLKLLNMSLTACVLILAVLPIRALLKKAPRWSICLLWALVALRLVCPFTVKSNMSLIRNSEPITHAVLTLELKQGEEKTVPEYIDPEEARPMPESWIETVEDAQQTLHQRTPDTLILVAYIWLSGTAVMLVYALFSYFQLKRRVSTSTRLEGNIRQSEYVSSPFVLGVVRPTIYLPYGLKNPQIDHILAHERAHIRRGDHLIKPLGFAILSVHWFNPLVWVAYILLCRDIEAACDERVIKEMTREQRQSYSATLLRCSVHRRRIAACPVAFGESGVKQRIKGIMSYKKPVLWIVIAALLVGAATGVCFLTERPEDSGTTMPTGSEEQTDQTDIPEPTLSHRERMDALLDGLIDYEDSAIASSPERCMMLNRETYEELLSYDELALSYFIPKLRKADIHSYREHMMVRICAELTGVAFGNVRESISWYGTPQKWIAEYDRSVSAQNSERRLQPGNYHTAGYAHSGKYYELNEYGYSELLQREYVEVDYCVTADSLVMVYPNYGRAQDYTHGYNETVKEAVDWKWQSPDPTSPLYSDLAKNTQKAMQKSLGFVEGTIFEELLTSEECMFQPLKYGKCLVRNGDRIFLLVGAGSGTLLAQVHCVIELCY